MLGCSPTYLGAIHDLLARSLFSLLVVVLALSASGLSSAIASSYGETDDCCADGAGDPDEGKPEGRGDHCPPLCHACACSPAFAIPTVALARSTHETVRHQMTIEGSSQLPLGPPGRGVFHPPRLSC